MNIFSNRLFIDVLAFFVVCVVGSLLYMQHIEQKAAREFTETPVRVKELTDRQKPTPAAAPVSKEPPQGEHVPEKVRPTHTSIFGEMPSHSGIVADKILISTEEIDAQEKARRAFYASHGLEPPPPGYRYAKIGDGPPKLVKDKAPIINVAWGEGYGNYHQLTDREFAKYSCLLGIDDPSVIKRYGLSEEEVALGLDWQQELYEKTKGPRPTITAHVSTPASNPLTGKQKKALLQRMQARERELVPPPPESFRIDYNLFDTLIAEIRETLARR